MRVRFLKPTYFLWLLLLGGTYGASHILGLPHVRFSYDFQTDGNPFDPFADRYYTRCTYWGPHGKFTLRFPAHGVCPLFRFFTTNSEHAEG